DDGSTDGTADCLADLPVTVLRHGLRRGKGAALRTGFAEALARGATGALTIDGDGQHDPSDLPRLLAAAGRHPGHIIIGARLRHRAQAPRLRRMANAFGDWGVSWGAGYRIADTQSGQRYYPAPVLALQDVPGEDFVFEAQLLIAASRQLGVRSVAVPVDARPPRPGAGVAGRARRGLRVRGAAADLRLAPAGRAQRRGAGGNPLPRPGRRSAAAQPFPPAARPVPDHLARGAPGDRLWRRVARVR